MLIKERVTICGEEMNRFYSNENKYILQIETNRKFMEAIDRLKYENVRHYIETDEEIINND